MKIKLAILILALLGINSLNCEVYAEEKSNILTDKVADYNQDKVIGQSDWKKPLPGSEKHEEKNYDDEGTNKPKNDSLNQIVEVIIEEKEPLKLPEQFINLLREKGVESLTLGDKNGRIRLMTINGSLVNPCRTKTYKPTASNSKLTPDVDLCKFESGLGEAHFLIARPLFMSTQCGTCVVSNVARNCNINTNKFYCNNDATPENCPTGAATRCGLGD